MKIDSVRHNNLNLFRALAFGIAVAGALGALDLTLKTGRNNTSFILVAMFVAWVESPFIVCMAANIVSTHWSFSARISLYVLMILLTLVSLVAYSGVLNPKPAKPAAVFLFAPLFSWIFMIAVYLAVKINKKNKKHI